jgi:GNAT superfamily N-acetyltransferase
MMIPAEQSFPLLNCAIRKLITRIWLGSYRKVSGIYVVKRGERPGRVDNDQLQFYILGSNIDANEIVALLKTKVWKQVRMVVLIGEGNESAVPMLENEGFLQTWETPVYYKMLNSAFTPHPHYREKSAQIPRIIKVTENELPKANSFYPDFTITEAALRDSSFINWLLITDNGAVAKLQFIICPPHGAFCVIVAVREDQRRRGHFTFLMRSAENWAQQHGLPQMALFSGSFAAEIEIYPKIGYSVIGKYKILEHN